MKHRIHLPALAEVEEVAGGLALPLEAGRRHYLTRVLRLREGDPVSVFDGRGREWRARLCGQPGGQLGVEISSALEPAPAPAALILAQAWLKGGAMDRVVQKATELGVTGLRLFHARRSNVKLDPRRLGHKLEHLAKVAASAAEQCESAWVPVISCHDDLQSVLAPAAPAESAAATEEAITTLFLDIDHPPLQAGADPAPTMLVVGPEGGWTDEERALVARTRTVTVVGLGSLTLRAETAPLAALAAIRHDWGWRR